ncbi:hypothetical protein E2C01_084856 [Portunus trituberculatus]|uniref:Uncharacterized protein n=1 Tax=Portunus trituberculatus TaxID=210409 RepID=A0A5B7J5X4_PORTR|nr:hypothetical protein [Portunus trituberculatus]
MFKLCPIPRPTGSARRPGLVGVSAFPETTPDSCYAAAILSLGREQNLKIRQKTAGTRVHRDATALRQTQPRTDKTQDREVKTDPIVTPMELRGMHAHGPLSFPSPRSGACPTLSLSCAAWS